jgi:CheY-like chemotaxis protein
MQFMVERAGARTAIDRWGIDTIKRLKAFMPIDLILLDLKFPGGVSGYDIYASIRAEADLAGIAIVAMSGSDPGFSYDELHQKGFVGFIPKPINFLVFAHQISGIIEAVRLDVDYFHTPPR